MRNEDERIKRKSLTLVVWQPVVADNSEKLFELSLPLLVHSHVDLPFLVVVLRDLIVGNTIVLVPLESSADLYNSFIMKQMDENDFYRGLIFVAFKGTEVKC